MPVERGTTLAMVEKALGVLAFRVLGFRVWGLGFMGLGFLVQDLELRV